MQNATGSAAAVSSARKTTKSHVFFRWR